ncbi:TetR/AcrR family transcriptional regulator [Pengzhenrongella frigida]|uniref:TetR/AcrR family transcriptional regulator n=1 Tax=Pengzhenrongella frigida TaxID=1259133 RepID=A0A4V1ZH98_9MICO|nr:TetR/AcrR family transcriptional regulator [Cellulomonas sp. HLT2-17]RYV51294.1 TetR/AcrR family transcriptional regulator [Cellulomonas sp. HLT2-17]
MTIATPAPAPSRRRTATRARLLDAAAEVFAEKGLGAATVDDLAAAAGFTRGAFYSNFSTKDDLFYALFEQLSEQMVGLVRDGVELAPELDLSGIGTILDRIRPHARTWYLIQTEYLLAALRHPDAGRQYLAHRNRFEQEVAEVITEALRRLGRRPTMPIGQLTEILCSLYLRSVAVRTITDPAGLPADQVLGETIPGVLLGLSEPV